MVLDFYVQYHLNFEGINMKTRLQKSIEYEQKYAHIPRDYNDRLAYLYDTLHLNPFINAEILQKRNDMINTLEYKI